MQRYYFILLCFIIFVSPDIVVAKPVCAFGYLVNKDGNPNFDYFEIIFPNSFASSIEAIYGFNVIKPHKLNEILQKRNLKLEKQYEDYQLPEITNIVQCDLFVFGYFSILPDNRIKIFLKLYDSSQNELLTFTSTGKIETEIFKIIDDITMYIARFYNERSFFISKTIQPGSSAGILSNCSQDELNILYSEFIAKGFTVHSIQSNEIETAEIYNDDSMKSFYYITTSDNSFIAADRITEYNVIDGVFEGKTHVQWLNSIRELYNTYNTNYILVKNKTLLQLQKVYPNCDYLFIVVFNVARTSCWARIIDLKSKQLIFAHSFIEAKGLDNDVATIIRKLISLIQGENESAIKNKK